jgi:hypothetical protein
MDDPVFADMDNHNYHLADGSPAIGAGQGGVDMGAYGGPSAINDDDFPSIAGFVHCLIDGDTTTGNTTEGGTCILFDLGATYDITNVRLYRPTGSVQTPWDIYVGDTLAGCVAGDLHLENAWLAVVEWNSAPLTNASGRYIKFVVNDSLGTNLPVNAVSEFSYSIDGGSSWLTPVSTVEDCTDISGLCEQ